MQIVMGVLVALAVVVAVLVTVARYIIDIFYDDPLDY